MFGQSFLVNRGVRAVAKAFGASDKEAKVIGRIAGLTTAVLTFDPGGAAADVATDVATNVAENVN